MRCSISAAVDGSRAATIANASVTTGMGSGLFLVEGGKVQSPHRAMVLTVADVGGALMSSDLPGVATARRFVVGVDLVGQLRLLGLRIGREMRPPLDQL